MPFSSTVALYYVALFPPFFIDGPDAINNHIKKSALDSQKNLDWYNSVDVTSWQNFVDLVTYFSLASVFQRGLRGQQNKFLAKKLDLFSIRPIKHKHLPTHFNKLR